MSGTRWNRNLILLNQEFRKGKRGVVLEGSSRSGKTWSSIGFMALLDRKYPGSKILVIRETYRSFKTTLYSDFDKHLPHYGGPMPFADVSDRATFQLPFKSRVILMGADDPAKFHGAGSDFFFINEALDVPQSIFDQLEQRCRRFWWMDYNPKITDHWIYDRVCNRPDVRTFRSTFQDNPYISAAERNKILSYDPSNPSNVQAGTADDYMWKVYGLGQRAAPEGLIFHNLTWIDTFPENIEIITHGLDFGYTQDPTALCRVGRDGMNIYLQRLMYNPCDNADDLAKSMRMLLPDSHRVWADSSDPGMISDLRMRGLTVLAVAKFPGSIKYGIDLMKRFKLHIVRDRDFQREAENYRYREVNGIKLNEPIDKFNHLWDAARYAIMSEFRIS